VILKLLACAGRETGKGKGEGGLFKGCTNVDVVWLNIHVKAVSLPSSAKSEGVVLCVNQLSWRQKSSEFALWKSTTLMKCK